MRYLIFFLLSACGADYSKMPAASQPRALLWGASNPECLIGCEVAVSVSQGEKNEGSSTIRGGDVSQSQTLTHAPQETTSLSAGQ